MQSNGSNGEDLPQQSEGHPSHLEAVAQLPPVVDTEQGSPFSPVPPERDVSGASHDLEVDETKTSEPSQEALGTRVTKGVSWTLAGTIWTQALGVVRTAALARLLTEADFGVAAMAMTVIGALYTLTNTSVVASVISARFDDERELHRYANLVWTIEVLRGLVIAVMMLVLALPFAHFYQEPKLFPMLVALALTPLCTSLQNVGLHLYSRNVEMKLLTLQGLSANTINVLATIGLAMLTHNYWALVWGQVVGALITTISSFMFSSYRPRFGWDKVLSRRAFRYGKNQFIIGLSDYTLTMMDNVIVGYMLGKQVLGLYVVAYSFCTMARSLINNAFNSVIFPAFASANREDDPERLRALVERTFTTGTLFLMVLLTPLVAFAPAVLRVVYTTDYSGATVPMRVLLLSGFFAGLLSLFSAFFEGLDQPQIEAKGRIWDAILFLAILYPLTAWLGAVGAALTGVVAWAGAITWRWKWAHDLAPSALVRLPYLLVSAMGVSAVMCALGVLPWAASAGGWREAFVLTKPSPAAAWTQLLVGAPLVSLGCVVAFSALHPIARREVFNIIGKVSGKLRRA